MLQRHDERNRDILVNVNGRLTHRDKAAISPFDAGFQSGDAVWEGLRLYGGRIFRLEEHLARLRRGAETLGYANIPSEETIRREIDRTLVANGMRDGVHLRVILSRGVRYTSGMDPRLISGPPTLVILAEHKPPVYGSGGVRLATARHRRPLADVLDQRIHSANQLTSILAKMEANAAGVDDALMLDTRGFIAETNATHVFLLIGGTVTTPTTAGCPEGITRSVVLELCETHAIPHEVRDIAPEEIDTAQEMFCTGTMGEIVPVLEVDGKPIGGGGPGPVTQRLGALFAELTRS
ncbi:MAG: aminotransferase class IV [Planctomycetota bacterium]|jgi:branched-chain amino acid aminotransferase